MADGENTLGPLDAILGLHIRMAHGAVQRHSGDHFAELGLTQKQVSVLWLAEDRPGIIQADLAQRLQMDRATTMAIVHALEKRGLLVRARTAGDGRKVSLSLTDAGHVAVGQARVAITEHESWVRSHFTPTEADTLVSLLRRLHR